MEDVIREFKIVETEDGFRIEIKGDKERLRHMIDRFPFGMGMPGGMGFAFRGFGGGPWGGRGRRRGRRAHFWKEDGDHARHGHHGPRRHGRHKDIKVQFDFDEGEAPPQASV